MNRCIEHNPSDLYKYTKKAVIKDLEDILKGVKAPKVNAANLKKKAKPKQQKRSGRTEQTPDWYEDADTYYANVGKPKEQKPSVSPEEAARRRAETLAMLAEIDGK
jgi:hypothetical protein